MSILTKPATHEVPYTDPYQPSIPCRWAVVLTDDHDTRHILRLKMRQPGFADLKAQRFADLYGPLERRAGEIDAWLNEHAGEDGWTRLPPNKIGFADPAVAFEFRLRWC